MLHNSYCLVCDVTVTIHDDVHNEDDDEKKTMAKMAIRKQTKKQKYNTQ